MFTLVFFISTIPFKEINLAYIIRKSVSQLNKWKFKFSSIWSKKNVNEKSYGGAFTTVGANSFHFLVFTIIVSVYLFLTSQKEVSSRKKYLVTRVSICSIQNMCLLSWVLTKFI